MLRVLYLSANPRNTPELNLQTEIQEIETRLREDGRAVCFRPYQTTALTFDALERELRNPGGLGREDALRPNIIHFAMHGEPRSLQIENPAGDRVDLAPEALQKLIAMLSPEVRCIVLNACYSAGQAALLNQRVPCVIGMQDRIFNASAKRLSTSFYAALAAGDTVGRAFELSTNGIQGLALPGADVPKLYAWPDAASLPLVQTVNVFVVYAAEDQKAFDRLAVFVKPLASAGILQLVGMNSVPVDRSPGEFLDEALDRAHLIVNLLSQEFLADDRCRVLTQRTLRRVQAKQAATVGIKVKASDWENSPLGNLQPLPRSGPREGRPLKDADWKEITDELITVVRKIEERSLATLWSKLTPAPAPPESPSPKEAPMPAKVAPPLPRPEPTAVPVPPATPTTLPQSLGSPTRFSLRRVLDLCFPTIADFDGFVRDEFSEVFKQYSVGAGKTDKINTLFDYRETAEILKRLKQYPSFAQFANLLAFE